MQLVFAVGSRHQKAKIVSVDVVNIDHTNTPHTPLLPGNATEFEFDSIKFRVKISQLLLHATGVDVPELL